MENKEHEIMILRDALDHIARVARNSITQSNRDRWIQARAERALQGKEFVAEELPKYPKMNYVRMQKQINELENRIKELESQLIYVFDLGDYPVYNQGSDKLHELHELATAEEVNGLIRIINEYRHKETLTKKETE